MTREELQAIEERAAKATAGPWQTRFLYRLFRCARKHAREDKLMMGCDAEKDWANCDHIAHSRTDVPALAAALTEARKERDEARTALAPFAKYGRWFDPSISGTDVITHNPQDGCRITVGDCRRAIAAGKVSA